MALGLLFVLISGVWLGVSSPTLRTPSLLSTVADSILFIVLGFLIWSIVISAEGRTSIFRPSVRR